MLIFKIGDLGPYLCLTACFPWCLALLSFVNFVLWDLLSVTSMWHVSLGQTSLDFQLTNDVVLIYLVVKTYTLNSVYQGFLISIGHFPYTKHLLGHRELFKKFSDRSSFSSFVWRGHPFMEGGRVTKVVEDASVTQWQYFSSRVRLWVQSSALEDKHTSRPRWCIMTCHLGGRCQKDPGVQGQP